MHDHSWPSERRQSNNYAPNHQMYYNRWKMLAYKNLENHCRSILEQSTKISLISKWSELIGTPSVIVVYRCVFFDKIGFCCVHTCVYLFNEQCNNAKDYLFTRRKERVKNRGWWVKWTADTHTHTYVRTKQPDKVSENSLNATIHLDSFTHR